ncbi:MAG: sulfite exporter TauE/SafE family protein [Saprospiraceae bacterium]|nr:sulfite exporter TauE/SafE family protein [Saprospiraceae bacterium]
MTEELSILLGLAVTTGFLHTIFGPDHYLPFIVMAKARKWSLFKTIWITTLCGIGHVGSSVVIGTIGIVFGFGVSKIEFLEGYRGNIAAWLFIIFGLGYFAWGMWRAIKNKPHKHFHLHDDGNVHAHEHKHEDEHDHIHKKNITPWILFTIFVFGPCEVLIPLLMYPAVESSTFGLIIITSVFAITTILTMLTVVIVAYFGIKLLPFGKLERYMHAIAGAIIFLSGFAIVFLGL